jgi:hypothetical protein
MTGFRRTTSQVSESDVIRSSDDRLARVARFIGRLLLWGCVLLLLIRGALSMLSTSPGVVTSTRGATVTVAQPAHAEPAPAGRK